MSHRGTPVPSTPGLLDELNLAMTPKPFKTHKSLSRRSKSKKQMVQLERDAASGVAFGKKGRKSSAKPGTASPSMVLDRPGKPRLSGAAAVRANMKAAREARLAQKQAEEAADGAADPDASMPDADPALTSEEREATPASTSVAEDDNGTPAPDAGPEKPKDLTQYWNIDAPPSLRPEKKYCDVTGLQAPYTDPRTRMRYHNAEVFEMIRSFGPGLDQAYLEIRGARITI